MNLWPHQEEAVAHTEKDEERPAWDVYPAVDGEDSGGVHDE